MFVCEIEFSVLCIVFMFVFSFFFFKQKTAYEMRISDWSSDVCSSDLGLEHLLHRRGRPHEQGARIRIEQQQIAFADLAPHVAHPAEHRHPHRARDRSEEHTSELQSLMRISYAVFCLKKKK